MKKYILAACAAFSVLFSATAKTAPIFPTTEPAAVSTTEEEGSASVPDVDLEVSATVPAVDSLPVDYW